MSGPGSKYRPNRVRNPEPVLMPPRFGLELLPWQAQTLGYRRGLARRGVEFSEGKIVAFPDNALTAA